MMPGYNPYPGKAAGGKTQKKATATSRARESSPTGKFMTGVGKQLVFAPLYLVPGGSLVRGTALALKGARAARVATSSFQVAGATTRAGARTAAKGLSTAKIPKAVAGGKPGYVSMAASKQSALKSDIAATAADIRRFKGANRTVVKTAGAATVPAGAVAVGAATTRKPSGTSPSQSRSSRIDYRTVSGPAARSGSLRADRGATSGTVSAAIRQGRKQGPTKSEPTKTQPSQPKNSGKGGKATSGGQVPGRPKGTSVRTFAVQQRLKLAEEAAKAGNYAAARNYAKAAANIQKKGQGSAKSMKRVQRVARTYSRAAKGSE